MYCLELLDLSDNRIAAPVPVLSMPSLLELRLDGNPIPSLEFLREPQLVAMLQTISMKGCDELQKEHKGDTLKKASQGHPGLLRVFSLTV